MNFFINNDNFLLLSQGFIQVYRNKIVIPNSSSTINLNYEQVTKEVEDINRKYIST